MKFFQWLVGWWGDYTPSYAGPCEEIIIDCAAETVTIDCAAETVTIDCSPEEVVI